jgi:hypothetical protein
MHTISIPYTITIGKDVIHNKRLGYSVLVRIAYSHLSKSIPEKTIKQTLKSYQQKYNLESLTMENALVEAKAIHQADKEFQKSHQIKQQNRLNHNKKIAEKRNTIKQNIKEIQAKPETDKSVKNILKLKKQLLSLKPKKELQNYHLGHIVFGGKANLLAHQKRVNKFKQQIQFTQLDTQLTSNEIEIKVNELTNLIQQSNQNWKASRLRPLSICGETRKGGNRFFKLSDDLKTCYLTFIRKESGTKAGPSVTDTAELQLAQLNGKWNTLLTELVKLANDDKITLFFRLNKNKLDITYDETVLTKFFQLKQLQTKAKSSDTLSVKKIKSMNPLKRQDNVIDFKHPESFIMTKIDNTKAIGIDLNPEWIGVSVIQFNNNKDLSIDDVKQVKVLDYKLFKIDAKINNKNNEYNKKDMAECLSNIADAVFRLVHFYNIGKIYMEDGLGKLKGGTKSKHLNGSLNYWGRSIFTKILERKARLTQCDSLTVKYHVADKETGELLYRKVKVKVKNEEGKFVDKLDENGQVVTEERPVIKSVIEYKQGIKDLTTPITGLVVEKTRERLTPCVDVEYVWAGYSSIIGNMVDWTFGRETRPVGSEGTRRNGVQPWQVLSKESLSDSLDNTCIVSGLIPDACSAGIEIARRGIVSSFIGKVQLPLFDLRSFIVVKKNVLLQHVEQCYFDESPWWKLSSLLRKIQKETWVKAGFVGYRNSYCSYFVRNRGIVTVKRDESFGLINTKNDPRVKVEPSTRYAG